MNTRKAWIVYTLLRLLFFAVPFAAIYALCLAMNMGMRTAGVTAAVLAGLIAVSLSVILLQKPREVASESIYEWRNRNRTADDVAEDEAIELTDGSAPSETAGDPSAHPTSAPSPAAEPDPASEPPAWRAERTNGGV